MYRYGTEPDSRGSMLELSWGGQEPRQIGEATRSFLEDGDRLTLSGAARGDGYSIGFGRCTGVILPAQPDPFAETKG